MRKRIFLCCVKFQGRSAIDGMRTENLGLCYLLAWLKHKGFDSEIFDENVSTKSIGEVLAEKDLTEYIIIGFSVYSTNYLGTLKAIQYARNKNFKGHITMGGHYPSFNWKAILERHPEIDSIVVGEGEESLLKLANVVAGKGGTLDDIRGLAFHKGDSVHYNPPGKLLKSLDFPYFPDRTYYSNILKEQNYSAIASSRGCWGNCAFCSIRNFYGLSGEWGWRYRSAVHVVEEMKYINKTLGVTNFTFFDDNFIGPGARGKGRAGEIAREILERKLDIAFCIDCRPDDAEEELLVLLRSAGLAKISLGIESFVLRQQKLYNKIIDIETIYRVTEILNRLNILYSLYLILFDPHVTFDDLIVNLEHIEKIGAEHFKSFTSFLQIFSGIPLYEKFSEEKVMDPHYFGKTELNEYFIQYRFLDSRIEHILESWIQCEEKMGLLLSKVIPYVDDDKAFEIYRQSRRTVWESFYNSLINGKNIYDKDELSHMLNALMTRCITSGEMFISPYIPSAQKNHQ